MKRIEFTKMVASGNDFIVCSTQAKRKAWCASVRGWPVSRLKSLARNICDRKFGVGADGLLVLESSKGADIGMRIFNADGSEAQMCGNGARCVALHVNRPVLKIQTDSGVIQAQVSGDSVRVRLTEPRGIKLDMPVRLNQRVLRANFINTGVPHAVIFVEGLDKMDVARLGRPIRFHKAFSPQGVNVDFVEVVGESSLRVRTYERGVEDETLSCGTGSVASALVYAMRYSLSSKIDVHTKSGEVLKIYFDREDNRFSNIWLEGKVRIICQGVYNV